MKSEHKQSFHPTAILILFPLMMLFIACAGYSPKNLDNSPVLSDYSAGALDFVRIDGSVKASITVEIADTPETQMKGLMGRKNLSPNKGMLFVFKRLKSREFWMKNTPISLDIIFIGADGCILNIATSATPMSERGYRSDGPVKYVVEVRAGFAKHFKIDSSTCIRWRRL